MTRLSDDDLTAIRERYGRNSPAVSALLDHIDSLEAERAEGHRYYVAAYRAYNGDVIVFGHEVLDLDYAKREAIELSSDDDATPMFVATRVVPPWLPVEEDDR